MRRPLRTLAPLFATMLLAGGANPVAAQSAYFRNWPPGLSLGRRVAENYLRRQFEHEQGKRQYVIYPEVCAGYGALTVADLTKDKNLKSRLIEKLAPLWTTEGQKHISSQAHVDYRVFGAVPLELYLQTRDQKYLVLGKNLADEQWANVTPDGITAEARYWIDDMYLAPGYPTPVLYATAPSSFIPSKRVASTANSMGRCRMITAVQVQAYRATADRKYIDRAALTMTAYLDKLQQPNGLFYHAPDSQFFWGRGDGWVAAGMTELLRSLPKKHPKRARILEGYTKMMTALLKYQSEDGLWRQLIDHPESWVETSSTGMFTFAMITGVKSGWLDRKLYGPSARKAWLGLVKHLDENANMRDVCVGTNKGFTVQYYLDRDRKVGDLHGQAPLLWSATALLR